LVIPTAAHDVNRILLLDASEDLQPLVEELQAAGYHVSNCPASEASLHLASEAGPDIIILNLTHRADLPPALQFIRTSRTPEQTSVIALLRAEQIEQYAPSPGVDDFVVYPGPVDELRARLRQALWRRSRIDSQNMLRCGDLLLDLANYQVFVSGRPVELTFKEYELLRFLASNADKVFTRETLLNRVWGYDFYGGARTVDVHVRRLRSKLEEGGQTFIETVRNVGYRFRTSPESDSS
jgi:two-component system alkaline phosphatase synthesis response regulator PhoP